MHINTDIILNVIIGVFIYKFTLGLIRAIFEVSLRTLVEVKKEVGN